MAPKRIAIVGNGKMACDAASRVLHTSGLKLVLCIYHSADEWSALHFPRILEPLQVPNFGCRRVTDAAPVDAIRESEADLILSVNNFDIFPSSMLALTEAGIVNFHNGPLPTYRGVNIPSWAILNREERHGVTWHRVDDGIDTGEILAESLFDLDPRETAISLTFRCIKEGLALLPNLLSDFRDGNLRVHRQPDFAGHYFARRDVPNEGFIDLSWPPGTMDAFLRALYFHPFPNSFVCPRLRTSPDRWVAAQRGTFHSGPQTPDSMGTVIALTDRALEIAVSGGRIALSDLTDEAGAPLSIAEIRSRVGDVGSHVRRG